MFDGTNYAVGTPTVGDDCHLVGLYLGLQHFKSVKYVQCEVLNEILAGFEGRMHCVT